MNAVEFIKQYGWGEAKRILHDARGCASVRLYDKYEFSTDDLKQLVDAWELVGSKGGLCQAKKHYLDMREAINQVYYIHSCEFESQELKKAIELVESVK